MSQTRISPSSSQISKKSVLTTSSISSMSDISRTSKVSKASKVSKLSKLSQVVSGTPHEGSTREIPSRVSFTEQFLKETVLCDDGAEGGFGKAPIHFSDLIGPPEKQSLSDFQRKTLDKEKLFPTVMAVDSTGSLVERKQDPPSILVTGFGMRNLRSLQNALDDENKRVLELYKQDKDEQEPFECDSKKSSLLTLSTSSSTPSIKDKTKSVSHSETVTDKTEVVGDRYKLQYLMGIHQGGEEDEAQEQFIQEPDLVFPVEAKPMFIYSTSASMVKAQHYLRIHRIFDFFQYIVAQLLEAAPDNPINFILELLNKCLLYRAGAGPPPVLYETRHIVQLFHLMDRMGTGFVDIEQYIQGMATLGICEYNKEPTITDDGISKEVFVEEVYEAELNLFNDLIRRKYVDKRGRKEKDRPIDYGIATIQSKTSYFMPTDLFRSLKTQRMETVVENVETEQDGLC